MLPEQVWNPETTFIDIACVDGSKLQAVYTMLDKKLSEIPEYKDIYKRREHIVQNQLYGICLNSDDAFLISRKIFGDPFSQNIVQIDNYSREVRTSNYSIIREEVKRQTGLDKFDVVLSEQRLVSKSNDFINQVELSIDFMRKHSLVLIPGKWAFRKLNIDNKMDSFNKLVYRYLDQIIHIRGDQDSDKLRNYSGICLMHLQNESKDTYNIKFECYKNSKLKEDWAERQKRSINLIPQQIIDIINKTTNIDRNGTIVKTFNGHLTFGYYIDRKQYLNSRKASDYIVKVRQGKDIAGYQRIQDLKQLEAIDEYKAVCRNTCGQIMNSDGKWYDTFRLDMYYPYEIPNESIFTLRTFKDAGQCRSFISYMNTRTISLMKYIGQFNRTIQLETFRFIQNPNDWSVTYVDSPHPGATPDEKGYYTYNSERYCSLYVRYKLSKDDIDIIESIIKARK